MNNNKFVSSSIRIIVVSRPRSQTTGYSHHPDQYLTIHPDTLYYERRARRGVTESVLRFYCSFPIFRALIRPY